MRWNIEQMAANIVKKAEKAIGYSSRRVSDGNRAAIWRAVDNVTETELQTLRKDLNRFDPANAGDVHAKVRRAVHHRLCKSEGAAAADTAQAALAR